MKYRILPLLMSLLIGTAGCTRSGDAVSVLHVLRVGVSEEPDSLNPLFSHTAIADDIAALTLAPLFRYDDTGTLIAELAERVPSFSNGDISADGLHITLHLRRHLRWSDDMPLTVNDIVFTWRTVMNSSNNIKLRGGWSNIASIRSIGETIALVTLRHPDATVLSLFAGGGDAAYPPLPAHLLERLHDINHAPFNAAPLSSGPWILSSWQHGNALSLTPNSRYWRGAPKIGSLKFVVYPQASVLMTALQTGEIDYVDAVPEDRLFTLNKMPHMRVYTHTVATYRHLDFNMRDPILRDARVRLALIEGVHWDRLLTKVYHGSGTRAVSDIFPSSFAAPKLPLYSFDSDEAARLLDQSGWKHTGSGIRMRNGVPLALTIMSANTKSTSIQSELLIAADLQRLGVHILPKNMPVSYLFAQDGPLYTGRYQLAWAADTCGPDPDDAANWVTAAQPPNGANTVFLSDTTIDETASAARTTFDQVRRRALYQREQVRLHTLAPAFIFTWQRATVATTTHLYGVRPAPFYSNFWNSWQWRLQ